MKICLTAGLVLRQGATEFELVRQLNDDEYQFEQRLTRRPIVMRRISILKKIWNKTYEVVLSAGATSKNGAPGGNENISVEIDLSSLSKKEQDEIERRLSYISSLQKAHVTRGQRHRIQSIVKKVAARLKDKKPPSASSVMEWARKYQTAQLDPLALRSGNACRVRARRLHPAMDALIKNKIMTVYLTRARHSLQHTLDQIKREAKELVRRCEIAAAESSFSLSSLSRRVQEIDLYRRIAAREGHARARMVCRTVMGGAGAAYPLQRVEIDHTPLNWVVICDRTGLPLGRPLLTIVIDSFSNYVLGLYLSFYGPGLSSVSGVLRNAIMPKDDFVRGVNLTHRWLAAGIPDEFFIDNGLEFHAAVFKLMAWELASDLTYCRVRTPWLKPHVERFFATLDFLSLVRGRVHKRVANVMNLDPRKDAAIKFSDLVKGLIMFVCDVHPFEINERKLARPYDLMLEGMERCPPASFPSDIDQLRRTTALSKQLTLSQGGIELRGIPYGREELLPLRKRYGRNIKTLVKWDPDDIDYIWIQDPEEKGWLHSPSRWPDYTRGLSWNQHIVTRNFARRELKLAGAYDDLMDARLRLHDHWMDATSHRTAADSKLAAQYAGVTSAKVMSPDSACPAIEPQKILADAEIPQPAKREVPVFESFTMN